jgi:hypothetical protein
LKGKSKATAVERPLEQAFTPAVVDVLPEHTGYSRRRPTGTALPLMLAA